MKLLAVSILFSLAQGASVPTRTELHSIEKPFSKPQLAADKSLSNAERMAAGLPLKKPRSLYSPLFGNGQNSGDDYTTMQAAENSCAANTQEEGYDLVIQQDDNDVPFYYYCVQSPGNIVDCPSTDFVYYKRSRS